MIPLGSKLAPSGGVISWNNSNREDRIHFVGKLTQVSNSGPSWPSCLWVNVTFYDAVNIIHDVITTPYPFPYNAKFMFVSVKNNETQQIRL